MTSALKEVTISGERSGCTRLRMEASFIKNDDGEIKLVVRGYMNQSSMFSYPQSHKIETFETMVFLEFSDVSSEDLLKFGEACVELAGSV